MISRINIFIFSFIFSIAIIFPTFSFAQSSKFYQIFLNYNNGTLQLKNVVVYPGDISQINPGGGYRLELLSLSKTSLHKTNFKVPTSIHGEVFDYATGKVTGKETQLDTVDIVINVPYFPNGKEINVYDSQNKKILTIPVQQFAEVTPTPIVPTPEFKVMKLEKGTSILLYVGLGGLVFGIVFALYLFRQYRRKDNPM